MKKSRQFHISQIGQGHRETRTAQNIANIRKTIYTFFLLMARKKKRRENIYGYNKNLFGVVLLRHTS